MALKESRFSKPQLLVFALVFAAIGGILIYRSFAANPNLPGDVNNDNVVDISDLSTVLTYFNTTDARGDANNSGRVDITDLSIVLSHYGSKYVPPTSGSALKFKPPVLTSPTTINITNSNRRQFLDKTKDYVLKVTEPLKTELWIDGGHNVVVIGAHITVDSLGTNTYQDNTGVKVRFATGTVFLEGFLIDGPYLVDGVAIAGVDQTVVLQNFRVEQTHPISGAHPDCVQIQQGVKQLNIDKYTCTTDLQTILLGDHDGAIGGANINRTNGIGQHGKYIFWRTNPTSYPVSYSETYMKIGTGYTAWNPNPCMWVMPDANGSYIDGTNSNPTYKCELGSDSYGQYVYWPQGSTTGKVYVGNPPGGDFVPLNTITNYVSPGYQ